MLNTAKELRLPKSRTPVLSGKRFSSTRRNADRRQRLEGWHSWNSFPRYQRDLAITCAMSPRKGKTKSTTERNRLVDEQSPDLLSYAQGPVEHTLLPLHGRIAEQCCFQVNWYPWGEEAFQKAIAEEKMIFLSVGYLSCHWCHVMDAESFQNKRIAKLLNENFIPVKVDREERPDVDRFYTAFIQGILGYSGWPLNIFLTPELDPIFGATYMPTPASKDIPAFESVLAEMLEGWNKDRETAIETVTDCCFEVKSSLT